MKQNILLITGILLLFSAGLQAQQDTISAEAFKPSPGKAVLYSALFPGMGQIYNRKYWKLPIVYGGFLGCMYAINWNNTTYQGYRDAYNDLLNGNGTSWMNYVPYSGRENPEEWLAGNGDYFARRLKNGRDIYRRYRELSWIVTAGLYALCMIDAYVDAQLFEFDISDDLSFKVEPVMFDRTVATSRSFGLQCSFAF